MSMILAMAGIGMQFNAGDHKERQIDTVPDGWYPVQIVNSEIKPTKTLGGARLNLQFKVLQGDFAGRVIFGGYNVQNSNPVAVSIAMEELAELSRAVKVPVWNDTEQLHGIPFNLKVKVVKQEGYDDKAEPKQYKAIEDMAGVRYATKADIKQGAAPVSGAFAQQPTQQAQPGWGQPQQPQQQAQPQQQTVQQQPVQQAVQQPQQPVQDPGSVNFTQAAQTQTWGTAQQQPQQQVQQAQPVQQQAQPQQTAQQPVQQQQPLEGEHIPAQPQTQQPTWAQQQVQPGSEQPVQQNTQQQPVQEQPDDIQQAAQSQTPPWKMQAQE
ncbi:putative single-stranded DNA-binding protein [Klebsiella phage vB_KppS-Pokey]|nr:putative single-stranded DNA-binding protein [Klebsiella phage vB_KppS-Pokey]